MIIQMQVARRGNKVVVQDDGSRKLFMKTVQDSLRDGDMKPESTMIVWKVYLSWEE